MEKGSMKNKQVAGIMIVLLVLGLIQITLNFAPLVFSDPGAVRKEFWQVVTISNTLPYNTIVDVNVTVNSRKGVNIACSTNVTRYFGDITYWQGIGYATYWDWLNGTSMAPYHWGEMDWSVSNGSLTSITYNDIQFWGDMYSDSGGGVNYTTFMGNTYMADWNLSSPYNDPDIIYQGYWQGNQVKMIDDMTVPASGSMSVVFKIVMTEPGGYTFNITTTPGVTATPSTWAVGGAATLLVPDEKPTIQAAIDAASPGDMIVVTAGTYNENQVLINKPVKVIGSGANVTAIDGGNAALSTLGLVRITASTGNVTFSGFTVRNAGAAGGVRVGIYTESNSSGITYTISNNKIYGTNNPGDAEDYGFYAQSGKENIVFRNNSVTQTGANNIVLELHTGSTEISYNTLEAGIGLAADAVFFMTYGGVNVTTLQNVSYNTFDMGMGGTFDYDHRSTGVTFASPGVAYGVGPQGNWTNMVISGNTFNNLKSYRRAIGFWNNDNTLDNIISPQVTSNTINGVLGSTGSYGISIYGRTINANMTGNTINGTAVGIYLRSGDAPGNKINSNNIVGNTIGVDWTLGTTAVDASYNWWGNETGPTHPTNPDGRGDSASDNVLFEPWLIKPNPPLAPISVVYVNPQVVTLTAPALGTFFTVNVTIANVTMLYGYQFSLLWNNTFLSLTSVIWRIPSVWGTNYFIGVNNPGVGSYTFGASARSPAPPFNGTTSVASLRFQNIYDPVYPDSVGCNMTLANVTIADPNAKSIPKLVYSGIYSCISLKPKLLFMSDEYTAKKVPTEFDADINVTSVVNLYAFDFNCTFNTTLLNVVNVNIPALGGNPAVIMGWDNNVGYFHVSVTGITPPANGSRTIARVRFKVQTGFVWNTQTPSVTCTLVFNPHNLTRQGDAQIEHDAVNGTYVYRPVPGDVSMDGLVDIVDLLTVAQVFGSESGGPPYHKADLNHDGKIDILDIILVARNFGRTEP
jgi:hypothetical protein